MANKLQSLIFTAILVLTTQSAYADSRIKTVQEKLLELGYTPGIADGNWGRNTEAALKQFLSSKGLIFYGIARK